MARYNLVIYDPDIGDDSRLDYTRKADAIRHGAEWLRRMAASAGVSVQRAAIDCGYGVYDMVAGHWVYTRGYFPV